MLRLPESPKQSVHIQVKSSKKNPFAGNKQNHVHWHAQRVGYCTLFALLLVQDRADPNVTSQVFIIKMNLPRSVAG